MNFFLRLSLVVLLAGCKARAPKLEPECTFTQDCQLIGLGPDCCDLCQPAVGNVASVAALQAYCAQKPAAACPKLDCAAAAATAWCDDGRCRQRDGVHP